MQQSIMNKKCCARNHSFSLKAWLYARGMGVVQGSKTEWYTCGCTNAIETEGRREENGKLDEKGREGS